MKLTDHQQKMLDGAFGKGKAMAMQIQIGVGKCFDAERLVPVSRAHVSLSAQEADIWFAGKLLDAGASCAIAPTVNPGYSVDYFRSRLTDAAVENMRKTERIYRGLGARLTYCCTPSWTLCWVRRRWGTSASISLIPTPLTRARTRWH